MRAADDGRHMMFAVRGEVNVAQEHHFPIPAGLREHAAEDGGGVFLVPFEPFLIRLHNARRCLDQTLAARIVAGPPNECPHGCLRGGTRGPRLQDFCNEFRRHS